MKDETLVEPFAVTEYFVDGFADYQVRDGILTCAAYRTQRSPQHGGSPVKVVIFRIVCPVSGAQDAAERTKGALSSAPTVSLTPAPSRKAHH